MGLPDMSIAEAAAAGARTLVVGVANRGGVISPAWLGVLTEALAHGMDLASGLHNLLRDEPELVAAAMAHGRRLHDVRVPPRRYPIADGRRRSGRRCLAVGTDCSVGKMYTALAMEREMHARGMAATFRATGQTGILITGGGVPLDAVVADFMAGAIEWLTPDNEPGHWDLIEGQGSLFHPSYSGVTLALVHGGQPDALILCHEPTRAHMRGLPGYALPSLEALRDLSLAMARMVNPEVARHRRLDQHRRPWRGGGAGAPRRDRGADGAADGRSLPPGRGPAGGRAGMRLSVRAETFPIAGVFTISRGSRTEAQVLTVTVEEGGHRGRGECVPYARYGETLASVTEEIEGLPERFDREELQELLPPGAARNAVDCALWDLAARQAGRRVWELAGLPEPGPEMTAYTLSLDTPEAMRARRRGTPTGRCSRSSSAAKATWAGSRRCGRGRRGRGSSSTPTRGGRPTPTPRWRRRWSGSGWSWSSSRCRRARTRAWPRWRGRCRSAPTRAATTGRALPGLAGKYDVVNIKLDKTGGLTEALALREAARAAGFGVMVGCMVGSSLAHGAGGAGGAGRGLHRPRRAAPLGA